MIELDGIYTDVRTRAPVVVLRTGGSLFVGSLIAMLAADPGSDSKRLAYEIADATGQAIHRDVADVNRQILWSREREHMRDHQLSELMNRIRLLWEAGKQEDYTGLWLDRYELLERLRLLMTTDDIRPTGCDTIRNVHLIKPGSAGCTCGQLIRRR